MTTKLVALVAEDEDYRVIFFDSDGEGVEPCWRDGPLVGQSIHDDPKWMHMAYPAYQYIGLVQRIDGDYSPVDGKQMMNSKPLYIALVITAIVGVLAFMAYQWTRT